jgi:RHS repeat-associated protein
VIGTVTQPTGEVVIDQAFAAGGETITTPLADHQGSPRILYGGAANSAPGVRQSVDYAPFGRITEVRDDAGAPTTADLDAAFGHHGSLQDQETGLQLKGARWYSPGLGRFVSVDPIQDGTNWYAFAGNDPVNQSDPTGLKAIWSDPRNTLSAPKYSLQSTSFDTSLRTSVPRAPSSTQQIGLTSTAYTPYSPPPIGMTPGTGYNSAASGIDYSVAPLRFPKREVVSVRQINTGRPGLEIQDEGVRISESGVNNGRPLQFLKGMLVQIEGKAIDNFLPHSAPSYEVTDNYGYRRVQMGGDVDPGTGLQFALMAAAPFVKRPVVRTAPAAAPTQPSLYRSSFADDATFYKVADDGIDLTTYTPSNRSITPYRDPARPGYNTGATHIDHIQARSLGGSNAPSNLQELAAETNLRKGGHEGALKQYEQYLRRHGMTREDARSVIQPEIDAFRVSPPMRPMDPRVMDRLPANPLDQGYPY